PGGGPRRSNYTITSQDHRIGELEVRIEPDGTRIADVTYRIRGAVETVHTALTLDGDGAPRSFRATGKDHFGEVIDEHLDVADGALVWRSTGEQGRSAAGAGWYLALDGASDFTAALARSLLRARGHRVPLLPAGEAWLDDETVREIAIAGVQRRLHRVAIAG